jgi:hypothetical protein
VSETENRAEMERGVVEFLKQQLGSDYPNLGFLRAVIRHLGAEHAGELSQRQVAESIVTILRPAGGGEPSAAALLENPEILASFFQNADLLDPHGADSMAISRMVMKALEGVHGAG